MSHLQKFLDFYRHNRRHTSRRRDTRYSLFLDGIIIWIIGVPMAYLGATVFKLPVYFVYLCAMSEEVAKWILRLYRYSSRKWINNLAAQVDAVP